MYYIFICVYTHVYIYVYIYIYIYICLHIHIDVYQEVRASSFQKKTPEKIKLAFARKVAKKYHSKCSQPTLPDPQATEVLLVMGRVFFFPNHAVSTNSTFAKAVFAITIFATRRYVRPSHVKALHICMNIW